MPTRLLLIDDDATGLLALSEALRNRLDESVIDTALSAQIALGLLRDNDYHAVVSDLRMAGMDGLALLNQVRERWPDTPVLLMTAAGTMREGEALRSGAISFIEKPVNVDRLTAVLKAVMAKSQMRQAVRKANRESISRLDVDAGRIGLAVDPTLDDRS
jgi:DNA-binding NtrC family response regulator